MNAKRWYLHYIPFEILLDIVSWLENDLQYPNENEIIANEQMNVRTNEEKNNFPIEM